MRRADLVSLPVHGQRRPAGLHDAVHADVADAAHRVARDHHGEGDVRAAVVRPALDERQLVEIHVAAALNDFLARSGPALGARRKLSDLEQPGQQRELGEQAFGNLHLEQLGDSVADVVERLDAERHRHSSHRAEQVDRHGDRRPLAVHEHRLLEQQRFPAAGLLHDSIGDLAQLEIQRHRMRYAHQLASRVELLDERRKRIDRHEAVVGAQCAAPRFVPRWMAATPSISEFHSTSTNPASCNRAASRSSIGKFATERGR